MLHRPFMAPLLFLAGLGLLALCSDGAAARTQHAVRTPAVATLELAGASAQSAAGPDVQVTMPPVGLSLEYPVMAQDLGSGACPPAALVTELIRLGSPPLSLGGQSQDFTAPAGALSRPFVAWEQGTTYSLPADFWSQLHCLLSATKDPLTAGINARIGNPSWAAQMVAGAQSAATNGLDFSLGNEPDHYYLPDYSSLDKPQVDEEAVAVKLYLEVAGYLLPALGGAPVIGPELSEPAR